MMLLLTWLPILAQRRGPGPITIEPVAPELIMEMRLIVLLAAISVGAIAWLLADVGVTMMRRWRAQAEMEAETQMQDMLMMMPAARYINMSLAAAGGIALLVFLAITLMFSNYNWRVGGVLALVIFAVMMIASRLFLKVMKKRRLDAFNDQLEESLMSMSNSLKAGFSIMQAIEMVVRQNRNPISLEFKLMVQQVQLGMTIDDALRNMADRVQSEDFFLTVSAITTARQTGGDLTGIFERLSSMIRERLRIQRRINSITAMGRLQGLVLSLVPVAMFLVLAMIDPSLVQQFFSSFIGLAMFTVVVLLLAGGFLVIRKIVNIDI